MEIHNYFEAPQGSYHLAEFSIYLNKMDFWLHKCRLYKSQKGGLYIRFYSFPVTDDVGKKTFSPVHHPGNMRAKEFNQEVMHCLKPFLDSSQKTNAQGIHENY